MFPSPVSVATQEDFLLSLEFDNGEERVLDMKPFLNFGLFRALQSRELFQQVRVSFDSVEWPRGIDLDPEFLYQKSTTRTPKCQ
jgi:hypothetical protein